MYVLYYDRTWLDDCLYYLSAIYFFKVIFVTFPFSFWSFTFNTLQYGPFEFYYQLHRDVDNNCDCFCVTNKTLDKCGKIILWIVASLFSTIMVFFLIVLNTVIFEVCNLTFLVIAGFSLNVEIENNYGKIAPIIRFCSQAYDKMDLNLRIYIVNYCVRRQISVNGCNLSTHSVTDPPFVQIKKSLTQWMAINKVYTHNNNNDNDNDEQKEIEMELQVNVVGIKDNENKNKNKNGNVLSLHDLRNQYCVTVFERILSNIRGSTSAFYPVILSDCSCFDIRAANVRLERYLTLGVTFDPQGLEYAYQKCGTMFLFPLYVLSSIYTLLYPILCFICLMGLLSNQNYTINNISLFNRFEIGLSCLYIFVLMLICLLLYKVYKFYYILWHLISVKSSIVGYRKRFKLTVVEYDDLQNCCVYTNRYQTYSGAAALIKHIQLVYYNMYTLQLTAHILNQFFGPFSNIIFEMIGLNNTENAWDLIVDSVPDSPKLVHLVVSKQLFDKVNTKLISGHNIAVDIETVKKVQQLQKYSLQHGEFINKNSCHRSAVKDLL